MKTPIVLENIYAVPMACSYKTQAPQNPPNEINVNHLVPHFVGLTSMDLTGQTDNRFSVLATDGTHKLLTE